MPTTMRDAVKEREPASQEAVLLDYAERLQRHCTGRIAVHVHLSQLQSCNRRAHHIRVAINTFDDLVKQFEGALFHLMNHDLVVVFNGASIEQVDAVVLRLRYLFSEDQLSRLGEDQTGGGFCTWYILENDYRAFLAMARRVHQITGIHRQESQRLRELASRRPRAPREPITLGQLARVEEVLSTASLQALVRNQAICAITRNDPPEPVLEELYVSIEALETAVSPESSLTADPWLFQHLTQVLDRRMLALVQRDAGTGNRAFSLNLNVATVLSPEFQKFDQGIGIGVRGRMVIELQKVDIFHDMGAYLFARDYLRERGYKICLDGLTHLTLPYIDRERLGLDLLKVYWSTELVGGVRQEMTSDLAAQVRRAGQARIILCRCDSEDPIRLGQELGVSLFQGRYVDQLLTHQRSPAQKQGSARFR